MVTINNDSPALKEFLVYIIQSLESEISYKIIDRFTNFLQIVE